jgi:uncharacterized ParB-like nuclease family protein
MTSSSIGPREGDGGDAGPPPGGRDIPLDMIRDDARISPRSKLNDSQVKLFTAIIRERGFGEFPPELLAGPREDGKYAAVDGRHRIESGRRAGRKAIPAAILPWSTPRELFRLAVQESARHGLPLM